MWAIKSVTASPFREDNITISIVQNYTQVNGLWFPLELNYELRYGGAKGIPPFSYIGKSYISEVEIGNDIPINKSSQNNIEVSEGAASRDSLYWDQNRTVKLSQYQKNTYTHVDTLVNLDRVPFFVEKVFNPRKVSRTPGSRKARNKGTNRNML